MIPPNIIPVGVRVQSEPAPEAEQPAGYRDNPLLLEIENLKKKLLEATDRNNGLQWANSRLEQRVEELKNALTKTETDISWRKRRLPVVMSKLFLWFFIVPLWFAFGTFLLIMPVVLVLKHHYRLDNLWGCPAGGLLLLLLLAFIHDDAK